MSFARYPEYKETGLDWLPKVPRHWRCRKISWDLPYAIGWTPASGNEKYYDGEHPWVTIADMEKGVIRDTASKISDLAIQERKAESVPAGSLLFSFKLSVGKVAILKTDAYTNEAIAAFKPNHIIDLRFWKYAAPEFIPKFGRENIYGATLLNQDLISSVRFFAPPVNEQRVIAGFLDQETAKIDALIEEQQRLIELLKEKRQAVISHAVTNGVDPNAPMKDSGVEWLGEVPGHWSIARIKHITSSRGGGTPSKENPDYWNGAIPWLSPKDMKQSEISDSIDHITDAAVSETGLGMIEPQSVLIVVRGMILDHSIPVAITGVPITINQDMKALTAGHSIDPNFLLILLTGLKQVLFEFVDSSAHGTKTFQWERFQNLDVPLPPLQEQQRICSQVTSSNNLIDQLLKEANYSVQILAERRSALISAAVTGKIDVRNWQPGTDTADELPMAAEAPATYEARES